jgi:hypothetical protein
MKEYIEPSVYTGRQTVADLRLHRFGVIWLDPENASVPEVGIDEDDRIGKEIAVKTWYTKAQINIFQVP